MARFTFGTYNLVAMFSSTVEAGPAIDALRRGVDMSVVSVLTRDTDNDTDNDTDARPPDPGGSDEAAQVTDDVAKGLAAGTAAGSAIGGVAGVIAGAAAVAIPGIGPGLATGIWAGLVGGGFAGATAGGIAGAFKKMWEAAYVDKVRDGGVLIAVHTDDKDLFEEAAAILHREGAAEVHHYDHQGELVHSA